MIHFFSRSHDFRGNALYDALRRIFLPLIHTDEHGLYFRRTISEIFEISEICVPFITGS